MKTKYRIALNVIAIIILYLCLNFSLFFGLQVNTTLGNAGLMITLALVVLYAVFYKKLVKRLNI